MHPDEFWSRVEKSDTCWNWTGAKNEHGYGIICFGNGSRVKFKRAHRIVWSWVNGPIDAGMVICHKCDNPACVRLDHLFVGTKADNSADMAAKGRSTHGVKNARHKLTEDDVKAIVLLAQDIPQKDVAKRFGVSDSVVSMIVRGLRRTRETAGLSKSAR